MDGVAFLALLTLLTNIGLGLFITLFVVQRLGLFTNQWDYTIKFFSSNAVLLSWLVALTATLGSLYLSEVRGFTPCVLCWYQRIFMYPLSVILGVGYFRRNQELVFYVLPLTIIGGIIAAYHYAMQINPAPFAPCTTVGFSASCSERFTTSYGYITIPWMSLSAFVLITVGIMLFATNTTKKPR